jgi:hypothetical protein
MAPPPETPPKPANDNLPRGRSLCRPPRLRSPVTVFRILIILGWVILLFETFIIHLRFSFQDCFAFFALDRSILGCGKHVHI